MCKIMWHTNFGLLSSALKKRSLTYKGHGPLSEHIGRRQGKSLKHGKLQTDITTLSSWTHYHFTWQKNNNKTVLILRHDTYFMLDFQILYRWRNRQNISMLALVQHMAGWHRDRFLDPEVWERFLRHKLAPELMPAPSELQLPLSIEQHLEKLPIGEMVNALALFMSDEEYYGPFTYSETNAVHWLGMRSCPKEGTVQYSSLWCSVWISVCSVV